MNTLKANQCGGIGQPGNSPPAYRIARFAFPAVRTTTHALPVRLTRAQRKQYKFALWTERPHCQYCGLRIAEYRGATLDHVLPKFRGGSDTADNLVLSCWTCNVAKGARTPLEWCQDIMRGAVPSLATDGRKGGVR